MSALALKAHAKINLYLEVGARLPSGYHQISSLMQSLSLADLLIIEAADKITCNCDDPRLAGDDNLALRAARLLADRFNPSLGARIRLFKKIPVAAGLGGGSADAAAALLGLDRFWELGLHSEDLLTLALELGADVPFCLVGGTAAVGGFGERVRRLPDLEIGPILIIKPRPGLTAGAVYDKFDELGVKSAFGFNEILAAAAAGASATVVNSLANDLEPAAAALLPVIAEVKNRAAAAGASACLVSGSGPAMFAVADTEARLGDVARAVAGSATTWLTRGSSSSVDFITDEDEVGALLA